MGDAKQIFVICYGKQNANILRKQGVSSAGLAKR